MMADNGYSGRRGEGTDECRALNICLVAPLPPPYGGIAHWAAKLAGHVRNRNGFGLDVVNTAPKWNAVHNRSLFSRVFGGALQLVHDIFSLVSVLRSKAVDLVHVTTSGHLAVVRDLLVLVVCRFASVPMVYHVHFGRIPELINAGGWEWWLIRMVAQRCDAVVVIDRYSYNALRVVLGGKKLHLIPNFIDPAQLPDRKGVVSREKVAVFLGWVVPTKGIEELVAAWVALRLKDWSLKIVGPVEPKYRGELERRAKCSTIEFLGLLRHEEAMRIVASSDLFVLPSYTEGFPNAVVEAMALGTPIVATSVGAIPEMLYEGAGLIVEPRDADQLATAIKRLAEDDDFRISMGRKGYEKARENYGIDVVFGEYKALWEKVSQGA